MDLLENLCDSVVLITGATGLIGKSIIKRILHFNKQTSNPVQVIALVRNLDKAKNIFPEDTNLSFWATDICKLQPERRNIDYIIHAASQTSSKSFVTEPIETITTALSGTKNVLELAKINNIKGFVYLSSMEVYGAPNTDEKITENSSSNLDTMAVRSCYPESKRMCESLCASYAFEYGVPAKVVRLTQTFGPGVEYNDGRVFAEFARCAIEGSDIILNTKGETKRNYLYTEDAVNAIITVLVRGNTGEAYNAANESTYCSIYEMACLVAERYPEKNITVVVKDTGNTAEKGYAPVLHMNLDTTKLRSLGWRAITCLGEMYDRMIADMKAQKN